MRSISGYYLLGSKGPKIVHVSLEGERRNVRFEFRRTQAEGRPVPRPQRVIVVLLAILPQFRAPNQLGLSEGQLPLFVLGGSSRLPPELRL